MNFNKFEEYKLFVEDTARFSERRQAVNHAYVTINSLILTAISFLVKDVGLERRWQTSVAIPVLVAGLMICWRWATVIDDYKKLINFRFNQLQHIERHLHGSHQMYHAEKELFSPVASDQTKTKKALNFSEKEKFLPYIFAGIYSITTISLTIFLLSTVFRWSLLLSALGVICFAACSYFWPELKVKIGWKEK